MSEIARATSLLDVGRAEEALAHAQRAATEDPTSPYAQLLLGRVLHGLGRQRDALAAIDRGLALAPSWEWGHRLRARALLAQRRRRAALGAAREAVRLAPDLAEAHVIFADALHANHRTRRALTAMEQAVALEPDHAAMHVAHSRLLLRTGRWRQAEEAALRALALEPTNASALHNLGVAKERRKRPEEAMEHLRTASTLDPHSSSSREAAVTVARRLTLRGIALATLAGLLLHGAFVASFENGARALALALAGTTLLGGLLYRRGRRLASVPPGLRELARADGRRWVKWVAIPMVLFAAALAVELLVKAVAGVLPWGRTLAQIGVGVAVGVVVAGAFRLSGRDQPRSPSARRLPRCRTGPS